MNIDNSDTGKDDEQENIDLSNTDDKSDLSDEELEKIAGGASSVVRAVGNDTLIGRNIRSSLNTASGSVSNTATGELGGINRIKR